MSNSWLRLWHDMPTDPKWRTISRISGQSITAVISVYLHMMVCASNATERGRTHGWCDEDVASALDLDTDQVTSICSAMQGRVIEGEALSGWNKRQPKREDGAAERAKSWRNNKTETTERNRTQPNATERPDTDTEEDKERKKDPPLKRVRVKFEELSIDHISEWLAKKRSEGRYIRHDENFVLEKFKSHCIANGKKYDDYPHALRNAFDWDSCQPGKATGGISPSGSQTKDDRARAAVMRAAVAGGFA